MSYNMNKPKYIYLVLIILMVKAILLFIVFYGLDVTGRIVSDPDEAIIKEDDKDTISKDDFIADEDETFVNISPTKAWAQMENKDLIVLDVRTPQEFFSGSIKDAVNLDSSSANLKKELDSLERNEAYLIHCRTDNRSTQVAEKMNKMGFDNIYRLEGGIVSWQKKGLPLG